MDATTMDTTDDLVTCDGCDRPIPSAEYDAGDGLCPDCLAVHFDCPECGERTRRTDAHPDAPGLCPDCGAEALKARHQEALDTAADELRELAESIIDAEDLDAMTRAVEALRRLASNPPTLTPTGETTP
jgi:predicted RNA-binding Zn-ribbon protein involved in translation (DUF1610 family)